MSILAIYDVMKIQDYVFKSNKLKENIGASILVKKVLDEYLIQALRKVFPIESECITDWGNQGTFEMYTDKKVKAEIIYIGGGNAVVAFRNGNKLNEVTKQLSMMVFEKTYSLKIAVAEIDTEFKDFSYDIKKLYKKLNEEGKPSMSASVPCLNLSITSHDDETGDPITEAYISTEKKLKLKSAEEERIKLERGTGISIVDYIEDHKKFIVPYEVDYMISKKYDNSFVGVVHIDGNNMGSNIQEIIRSKNNYNEAVNSIRIISKEIRKIYEDSFVQTAHEMEHKLLNNKFLEDNNIELQAEGNKFYHLMRPIILGGDDITYICNAKLAIQSAVNFIKKININKFPYSDKKMSACAGIALVKNHFPFSVSYELSEQLCSSAKQKAKYMASLDDSKEVGSYIDFHIVNSGIDDTLSNIRAKNYNLPGEKIKEEESDGHCFNKYSLLCRPWLISDLDIEEYKSMPLSDRKQYDWNNFLITLNELKTSANGKVWPRSRLRKLMNVSTEGRLSLKEYLLECESRGYILQRFTSNEMNQKSDMDLFAPYFDVIEMLDYFVEF